MNAEKKLKAAFRRGTPDVLDSVLKTCGLPPAGRAKAVRHMPALRAVAAAAGLLLLFVAGMLIVPLFRKEPALTDTPEGHAKALSIAIDHIEEAYPMSSPPLAIGPVREERISYDMDKDLYTVEFIYGENLCTVQIIGGTGEVLHATQQTVDPKLAAWKAVREKYDEVALGTACLQIRSEPGRYLVTVTYQKTVINTTILGSVETTGWYKSVYAYDPKTTIVTEVSTEQIEIGTDIAMGYIGRVKAVRAALTYLDIPQWWLTSLNVGFSELTGIYEVHVTALEQEYTLRVHGMTGTFLEPYPLPPVLDQDQIPVAQAVKNACQKMGADYQSIQYLNTETHATINGIYYKITAHCGTVAFWASVDVYTGQVMRIQNMGQLLGVVHDPEDLAGYRSARNTALTHLGLVLEDVQQLRVADAGGAVPTYRISIRAKDESFDVTVSSDTVTQHEASTSSGERPTEVQARDMAAQLVGISADEIRRLQIRRETAEYIVRLETLENSWICRISVFGLAQSKINSTAEVDHTDEYFPMLIGRSAALQQALTFLGGTMEDVTYLNIASSGDIYFVSIVLNDTPYVVCVDGLTGEAEHHHILMSDPTETGDIGQINAVQLCLKGLGVDIRDVTDLEHRYDEENRNISIITFHYNGYRYTFRVSRPGNSKLSIEKEPL